MCIRDRQILVRHLPGTPEVAVGEGQRVEVEDLGDVLVPENALDRRVLEIVRAGSPGGGKLQKTGRHVVAAALERVGQRDGVLQGHASSKKKKKMHGAE